MLRKRIIGAATCLSLACATPVFAQSTKEVLKGTAIGAGGGAVAGAVVPGLSVGEGALIGAAGGAAVTAITKNKKWHRDRYGRKYYVNKRGQRVYARSN